MLLESKLVIGNTVVDIIRVDEEDINLYRWWTEAGLNVEYTTGAASAEENIEFITKVVKESQKS